jgi:hypothetical protein
MEKQEGEGGLSAFRTDKGKHRQTLSATEIILFRLQIQSK